jgi:hypothetical protein
MVAKLKSRQYLTTRAPTFTQPADNRYNPAQRDKESTLPKIYVA